MKFGKHIQKKQLEIPEYAASFVDYKALKKLIKELKNSPVTHAESLRRPDVRIDDPHSVLQANKAPFFFRLDRELDKVNAFYTVKEAESKVRLRVLVDKQKSMRLRNPVISRNSTQYITLEQGLRDFIRDLGKLQQFIEINATAFSKILKKWDKTSKSQTKELYLSRAVEVQPCFNHDVISELSDQANTTLLDCAAWAEGEGTVYDSSLPDQRLLPTPRLEQDETDSDLLDALNRGDLPVLRELITHLEGSISASERLTKSYLNAVSQAPEEGLKVILDTGLVDLHRRDEINDRNCLHKTAMTGRIVFLRIGLAAGVDPSLADAYGRIPLHYACMNGHVDLIQDLIEALPATIDMQDLDNFTPLIHGIVQGQLKCVEKILSYSAKVDPVHVSYHSPLNLACQHGSVQIVQLLLRGNPRIMPDAEGLYPQHLVARFGRDPTLLLMLRDYGANLDQADKLYQWTPLFHAASEGRVECLKALIGAGVDVLATDEKNLPALFYATWEGHMRCMEILTEAAKHTLNEGRNQSNRGFSTASTSSTIDARGPDVELIPDLSLPPPIIPTRRYGHNFLESKTTVVIRFEETGRSAVQFYDESKYPAARLTIAPRSQDILPRNILLPIQDENKSVSFEMNSVESFSVDFDVFPTFGKKVIAKASAPSEVFSGKLSSSGYHHLSLLDPRLRCVGQMTFKFQVIKPFSGVPLDITPFATYWKATSQSNTGPNSLVTGSSLMGEYIRVFVQLSKDGVPILYPQWTINQGGIEIPVIGLSYAQFCKLGEQIAGPERLSNLRKSFLSGDLNAVQTTLAYSFASLKEILDALPDHLNLELHILYPSREEEESLRLGPTLNLNDFVDHLLNYIFQYARSSRGKTGQRTRSIVFSSYNRNLCTALNWKQPNYPVLLCNDLGPVGPLASSAAIASSGRASMSIKEAVRIAQDNNFMGLVCRSRLLDTVFALVESIKTAGLVLVCDATDADPDETRISASPPFQGVAEGVDGILRRDGVLRFAESVDMQG